MDWQRWGFIWCNWCINGCDSVFKKTTNKWKKKLTPKIQNVIDGQFIESTKLSDYLNNLGIQIKHANKDFLSLNEIFIYPDIRVINDASTIQKQTWTPQEVLESHKLIYFLGTEEIGKTSLLKKLAQDCLNKGEKIIIFNGLDIKNTECDASTFLVMPALL